MRTLLGWLLIPAFLVVGLWPVPVDAQTQLQFEVTPFAGGTFYLTNPPSQFDIHRQGSDPLTIGDGEFKDQFTLGLDVGVRINERYGIEAFFSWLPTELSAESGINRPVDVDGYMYGLTFLYHFNPDVRFKPFVGFGLGGDTYDYAIEGWDSETEFMGNVVVGANVPLTDRLAWRLEARDCIMWHDAAISGSSAKAQNDLMLLTGLTFRIN